MSHLWQTTGRILTILLISSLYPFFPTFKPVHVGSWGCWFTWFGNIVNKYLITALSGTDIPSLGIVFSLQFFYIIADIAAYIVIVYLEEVGNTICICSFDNAHEDILYITGFLIIVILFFETLEHVVDFLRLGMKNISNFGYLRPITVDSILSDGSNLATEVLEIFQKIICGHLLSEISQIIKQFFPVDLTAHSG